MANVSKLMNQVFSQDLLLDKILKFSIQNEGELYIPTLCIVRTVNSSWLEAVTRILTKNKQPLFKLRLHKENSIAGIDYVEQNGKALDTFINTISNGVENFGRSIPPFSLDIEAEFLVEENFQSFLRFWTHDLAVGLLDAKLSLEEKNIPLIAILPKASFPLLTNLHVDINDESEGENSKNMLNHTNLIQAFLNGVESPGFDFTLQGDLPYESETFKYLSPPSKYLHGFDLGLLGMCTVVQELLLRTPLPNLRILTLDVGEISNFPDGLVFQILDKLKSTLVTLYLYNPTSSSSIVHLPVMKNLEGMQLDSVEIELKPEQIRSLEKWLPKLEILAFTWKSEGLFRNLVENCTYPKIKKLKVILGEAEIQGLELLQLVHKAFPNVTDLTISIPKMETAGPGLEYLFQEMKQLAKLRIEMKAEASTIKNTDFWDYVFTGIPPKMANLLRANPGSCEEVDLQQMKYKGVRNLENLTHFFLRIYPTCHEYRKAGVSQHPVISELAITLGFRKMLKLRELIYCETFSKPVLSVKFPNLC